MIRADLASLFQSAALSLAADGANLPDIEILEPRDPSHGDFACNFALTASKPLGKPPRQIAEELVAALSENDLISSTEIAGPGFINVRMVPGIAGRYVAQVLNLGTSFVSAECGVRRAESPKSPKSPNSPQSLPSRINLEYVSVNPNGPITVGSGRGAAFGSTLANVLEAAGHDVHREYYINDGTNSEQMRLFAETVRVWVRNFFDRNQSAWYSTTFTRDTFFYELAGHVLLASRSTQSVDARKFWEKILDSDLEELIWSSLSTKNISPTNRVGTIDAMAIWPTKDIPEHERPLWSEAISDIVPWVRKHLVWFCARNIEGILPDNGYRADYVLEDVAHTIYEDLEQRGETWSSLSDGELRKWCEALMIDSQRSDLSTFEVTFDTWFSEQSLHDSGAVDENVKDLIAKGAADEDPIRRKLKLAKGGVIEDVLIETQDGLVEGDDMGDGVDAGEMGEVGDEFRNPKSTNQDHDDPQSTTHNPQSKSTLWLRSTKFGDDMDRVLRRKDGRLTYIASDVAYHKDKFNRGSKPKADGTTEKADKLITVLGPDHHGYIGRLHAVVGALLEVGDGGELGEMGDSGEMGNRGLRDKAEPTRTNPSEPEQSQPEPTRTKPNQSEHLSELEQKLYRSPAERNACQAALAEANEKLEVVIFQIVRFVKDGKPAPMRKRDGNIYSLRDLMSEIGRTAAPNEPEEEQMRIGKDVARFFYLMRSHDTHMDFDIDLATKQSDENPVFYCQYAHARICSILERSKVDVGGRGEPSPSLSLDGRGSANEESSGEGEALGHNEPPSSQFVPHSPSPIKGEGKDVLKLLTHERELALVKKICDLPDEVKRCAEDYGVHRLTTYAQELAKTFHYFYDGCRVIQSDQPELTQARLALCEATKIGLKAVFDLLGISSPERMERTVATES